MHHFWNDDSGFVISSELVLVLTIAVLAMIVGLSEVAVSVNTELNDISNAIGALSQDFAFTGFKGTDGAVGAKAKSSVAGATFVDNKTGDAEECDANGFCDLVCGASSVATTE